MRCSQHYSGAPICAPARAALLTGRYQTDVLTTEAVDFIRRSTAPPGAATRQPFFLVVAYHAPHSPLQAPVESCEPFLRRGDLNDAVATMYGMVTRMDQGVGQVLDTLDATGCAEDTVVLVTSDNGPFLGSERHRGRRFSMNRYNGPFRGQKQDVLEGGIRVPAIVRWPDGLPAGAACDEMVHFCDWLPTLAAAAGVTPDGLPLDGCNQIPRLQGTDSAGAAPRFWQFNRYEPVPCCNLAMRDGPWKLYWPRIPEAMVKLQEDNVAVRDLMSRGHSDMPVCSPPVERALSEPGEPELYHIAEDPCEARNLADARPDRVASMRVAAENWFASVETERRAIARA